MEKAKILIVEDEVIVAQDIQDMVKARGYDALAIVSSGEAAIQKAAELKPDLVLMDIVLKGEMDGIEAAEQIRDRFRIPIVYLTAYAEAKTIERAKVTEPFGYLLKPFEERELHTAIEIALYKHKLETALRESEERFHTFFDSLPLGVAMSDSEGRILAANKAACRLVGYTQEELVGLPFSELTVPEDQEKYTELYNSMVSDERDHYLIDKRYVRKAGDFVWCRVHASAIRNKQGGFDYGVAIMEDLTEFKQVEELLLRKKFELDTTLVECKQIEEALERVEQKYREITEFLPDLIYKTLLYEA
jgi:PAS domain S-box-containing protein